MNYMTTTYRVVIVALLLLWALAGAFMIAVWRTGGTGQNDAEAAYSTDIGIALYVLADTLDSYNAVAQAADAGSPAWQASVRTYASNLYDACEAVRDQHVAAPISYQEPERLLNEAMDRCVEADTAISAAATHDEPAELNSATTLLVEMNELIRQSTALLPLK